MTVTRLDSIVRLLSHACQSMCGLLLSVPAGLLCVLVRATNTLSCVLNSCLLVPVWPALWILYIVLVTLRHDLQCGVYVVRSMRVHVHVC